MSRAVVMIITNGQGDVLLLKRSLESRKFPGEWCLPGGKVDWIEGGLQKQRDENGNVIGSLAFDTHLESDEAAAYREALEETGIDVIVFEDTNVIMGDPEFTVKVFKSLLDFEKSDVSKEFPNREHIEYGFFGPFNLPTDLGKRTKVILENTIFKKN